MLKAIVSSVASVVLAMPAAAQCVGDVTQDGVVSGTDLSVVLSAWGTSGQGDFDNDGVVGGTDLTILLGAWGDCISVPAWATLIEAQPDPSVVTSATLRAAITATGLAWRVKDTATQIEMLLIPPGTFQMGEASFAPPVHQVTLTNAFYLGRSEVTQAQWQARMGNNPSAFQGTADSPSRPVEQVSWVTVQGFLSATGMRLPTEAEWEHACRAGTTTIFHGSPANPSGTNDANQVGNIAWYLANAGSITRAVGGKAGNGFGLHDMLGNVFEWVNDWSSGYSGDPQTNPQGPSTGFFRVARGGSWDHIPDSGFLRSSGRYGFQPNWSQSTIGFRVSRNPF